MHNLVKCIIRDEVLNFQGVTMKQLVDFSVISTPSVSLGFCFHLIPTIFLNYEISYWKIFLFLVADAQLSHHQILHWCLYWVKNTSSYSVATFLLQQVLHIPGKGKGQYCKMLPTYTVSSSFCSDKFMIIHSIYLNEKWTFKFAWPIRASSEQGI